MLETVLSHLKFGARDVSVHVARAPAVKIVK